MGISSGRSGSTGVDEVVPGSIQFRKLTRSHGQKFLIDCCRRKDLTLMLLLSRIFAWRYGPHTAVWPSYVRRPNILAMPGLSPSMAYFENPL